MSEPSNKKRLMRPYEKFLAFVSVLILGYFILQSFGINIVEHEGVTTKMQRPGARYEGSKEVYQDAALEQRVQDRLEILARQFAAESDGRARVERQDLQADGWSKDEAAYFEGVKERSRLGEKLETARDWYRLLRASQQTYEKVRQLFATTGKEEVISPQHISQILSDEQLRSSIFDQMQHQFAIPTAQSARFAKEGRYHLNEWADFVATHGKGVRE